MLVSSIFLLCLLLLLSVGSSLQTTRGREGRGLPERHDPIPRPSRYSKASASASSQTQGPAPSRQSKKDSFAKSLEQPLNELITQHIFDWLDHNHIKPDEIRAQTKPRKCYELLEHIWNPIQEKLHIRPPTEIEIRRFLFQKIGKDSAFIRNVQRYRTAHGSTGQSGSHLTWPEDKYVQRLNSSLQSKGITLKALQECKEPLKVAKVVLPIFLTSKNRITDEGAIRARQLLTNVVLKPEWFIDETLLQLPENGLVGHTKSRIPQMSEQGRDGGVSNPDSHVSRSYDIIPEYQASLVPGALEIPQEGPGVIFQGGLTNPHYHSGRGWHLGSDGTSLVQGVSPFTHNDQPDLVPAALRIPDHSYAAAPQTSYTYPEHLLDRSWLQSSEEIALFRGMSSQTHNEQLPQGHGVYNDANVGAWQGTTLPLPHPYSLSLQSSNALRGPESGSQWNHYTDLSHGATERQQHEQYGPYGLYQQAFPPRPAPLRGQHGGSSSSSHPGRRQREGSLDREQQEKLRNMPGGSNYPFY